MLPFVPVKSQASRTPHPQAVLYFNQATHHGGLVMLILSRSVGQRIIIGEDIVLTVVATHGRQARLGIKAPENVKIWREELVDKVANDTVKGALWRYIESQGVA